MKTTADTITDEQIRALRTEAAEAGDDEQADLCTLALNGTPRRAWALTPYGARIRCAEAIDAALALATCDNAAAPAAHPAHEGIEQLRMTIAEITRGVEMLAQASEREFRAGLEELQASLQATAVAVQALIEECGK